MAVYCVSMVANFQVFVKQSSRGTVNWKCSSTMTYEKFWAILRMWNKNCKSIYWFCTQHTGITFPIWKGEKIYLFGKIHFKNGKKSWRIPLLSTSLTKFQPEKLKNHKHKIQQNKKKVPDGTFFVIFQLFKSWRIQNPTGFSGR